VQDDKKRLKMDELTITILCDNINGAEPGFKKDPGFSAALKTGKRIILFDTGMYDKNLANNLDAAGLKPEDIDAVVLSHNHNDHTNGLPSILSKNHKVPVYIHSKWESGIPFQGMDIPVENKIVVENSGDQTGLPCDIILTQPLYSSDYGGITEQAVIILLKKSFVLLCGCCHPGLMNFLKNRERLGIDKKTPFHILGGMHGFSFTEKQADEIKSNLLSITLCHCTQNINLFRKQFADKCRIAFLGETYKFP
jgi:7,8-dihydropterin-6-yl-methyl-4-(beta-D-ribofuranosyl)aminobenzene 5'-phosphate synthase